MGSSKAAQRAWLSAPPPDAQLGFHSSSTQAPRPAHPYQPVLPAQAVEGRLLITSSQCLNEQPRSWWPVAQGPLLSCVASPIPVSGSSSIKWVHHEGRFT